MKKIVFFLFLYLASFAVKAQFVETFDSNNWQWTEYSTSLGKAYIIDGVMRLDSDTKADMTWVDVMGSVATHAFLPMDPTQGFSIKCDALVEKIDNNKPFGIILDYKDDMNCLIFLMKEDAAYLIKLKEGMVVGRQRNQFKLQKQKKAKLDISIQYQGGELEFRVNDIQALLCRYVPIESNGFGFFVFGKAKVDFDNVTIEL